MRHHSMWRDVVNHWMPPPCPRPRDARSTERWLLVTMIIAGACLGVLVWYVRTH